MSMLNVVLSEIAQLFIDKDFSEQKDAVIFYCSVFVAMGVALFFTSLVQV